MEHKVGKTVGLAMVPVVLAGLALTATTSAALANSGSNVTISLLNSKPEIETQLEAAAKEFSAEYPSITVDVTPAPTATTTPLQDLQADYAAGNAPTIYMGDPSDVLQLKDKAVNLAGQPWLKEVSVSNMAPATSDAAVYGFPFAIEGYGIIYNVKVVDRAVGGKFNPQSINTQNALKNLLNKIKKSGVAGDYFAPMNWSLGNHYLGQLYSDQSSNPAVVANFIRNLGTGKVNLVKNQVFNGLMNTFDLLESYNIQKASPLAGQYATSEADLATGKVGLLFQGDWIWPDIQTMNLNPDLGFLPVPIGNNPKDYANTQIPVGATKFLVVNKVDNTGAQILAAEKFLDWLALNPKGEKALAQGMSVIPPFKNNPYVPKNPLARSIEAYMKSGKTTEFMVTLPSSHYVTTGNAMDQYMAGASTRTQLANAITGYWKANKLQ